MKPASESEKFHRPVKYIYPTIKAFVRTMKLLGVELHQAIQMVKEEWNSESQG